MSNDIKDLFKATAYDNAGDKLGSVKAPAKSAAPWSATRLPVVAPQMVLALLALVLRVLALVLRELTPALPSATLHRPAMLLTPPLAARLP